MSVYCPKCHSFHENAACLDTSTAAVKSVISEWREKHCDQCFTSSVAMELLDAICRERDEAVKCGEVVNGQLIQAVRRSDFLYHRGEEAEQKRDAAEKRSDFLRYRAEQLIRWRRKSYEKRQECEAKLSAALKAKEEAEREVEAMKHGKFLGHDLSFWKQLLDDTEAAGLLELEERIASQNGEIDGLKRQLAAANRERERMRDAIVKAAIPLEVLAAQIKVKRYAEMTDEFQRIILDAVKELRAALAGEGKENDGLVPAHNLKTVAFPDCAKRCALINVMGAGECESACPGKFPTGEGKENDGIGGAPANPARGDGQEADHAD